VNSLNFCKIYEQVLVFFLLLPPLCFSAASLAAHHRCFPQPPAAPSPLFLRHLAPNYPARGSPNPAGSSSLKHVTPLPARATTRAIDHQQLLAAYPRTSFWLSNAPSELLPFSIPSRAPAFLIFFLLRSTTSPELLCPPLSAASALLVSNFVLHQHRHISLPLLDPLFFLLPCVRSPERRTGDLTPRRRPVSSQTEVPPLLLPLQEHH
jgi:hypothetical protein